MTGQDSLATWFETERGRMQALAYRLLGTMADADDAVQETWLRVARAGTDDVDNPAGWLTTVCTRVCLDQLRARGSRRSRDAAFAADREEAAAARARDESNPERDALLGESVGIALMVVLDTLTPAERVAFVLHDLFDIPFAEIAPILDRSTEATRQLASRARRRVREASGPSSDGAPPREIVHAFLEAARNGEFEALLALLDPDVVVRADGAAVRLGAKPEVRGADGAASAFSGRARAALPALVDGRPGLVWAKRGRPIVVFEFTFERGRITGIALIAEPERLESMRIEIERGRASADVTKTDPTRRA